MSVEVELKLALVEPERLDALLAALPAPTSVVEQHNHYFVDDTRAAGATSLAAMVRVRETWRATAGGLVRDEITLTVKRRRQAEGGVFVSDEHEQPLDAALWAAIRVGTAPLDEIAGPAMAWLRAQGPTGPLRLQGAMKNRRHLIALHDFALEVDRTEYPDGTVDAEVEVETGDPEAARVVVERAAAAAAIRLVPQTLGKYARFLTHGGSPAS